MLLLLKFVDGYLIVDCLANEFIEWLLMQKKDKREC